MSKSDQFNYYRQQVLSFLYEKKGVVDFPQSDKEADSSKGSEKAAVNDGGVPITEKAS